MIELSWRGLAGTLGLITCRVAIPAGQDRASGLIASPQAPLARLPADGLHFLPLPPHNED